MGSSKEKKENSDEAGDLFVTNRGYLPKMWVTFALSG